MNFTIRKTIAVVCAISILSITSNILSNLQALNSYYDVIDEKQNITDTYNLDVDNDVKNIIVYMIDQFKQEHDIDLSKDAIALDRLKEAGEQAKTELLSNEETTVELPYIAVDLSGPKHLSMHLQRDTFFSERFAEHKTWTVLIYMAADNDLLPFGIRNIEQMKQVGSDENVNIIIHFDYSQNGSKKTKRLYIEKNKAVQIGPDRCMDSGDPDTLIDATCWAIDHFPSDHLCVVLWNHGSGALNPFVRKSINPSSLFFYNTETQKVELDRSIPFSDFVYATTGEAQRRGVCFDETTGNYLNDQNLKRAFEVIHERRGKPIDLVLFDACLMACTETAWLVHEHADYMGASQEVVLGPGYNYFLVLRKLREQYVTPYQFLNHVIDMYKQTYHKITNDYTHSGFVLSEFKHLHATINDLAEHIQYGLKHQKYSSVKRAIHKSSAPRFCTHFDEPTHIDVDHFLENLYEQSGSITIDGDKDAYITELRSRINACREAIKTVISENVAGPHFRHAHGVSIYCPQTIIHASYAKTEFARHNAWASLLKTYLL